MNINYFIAPEKWEVISTEARINNPDILDEMKLGSLCF